MSSCLLDVDSRANPAAELAQLISKISEDTFQAGWYIGVEFWLWELVCLREQGTKLEASRVPLEQLARLQELSQKIDGWVRWVDEAEGENNPAEHGVRFVPKAEWRLLYAPYASDDSPCRYCELPPPGCKCADAENCPECHELWQHCECERDMGEAS